jgi:hypothetical protein
MTDHPEWVWKRAAEVLTDEVGLRYTCAMRGPAMRTVASLIAKHEQPPVEPDEEVVQVVLITKP